MNKFSRWKSFDFGPETSVDEKPICKKQNKNRKIKEHDQPKSSVKKTFDFQKQLSPQSVSDLAVHSKKIEEIENWLKFALNQTQGKKHTQFLLLTGPTGCGKSITVSTICKSMEVNVTEWINPVDIDYDLLRGPGQATRFLDFFSESKYPSLFEDNTKKVLLVKEFPNIFIKRSEEFFNVLEECYYIATYPVIFICSDTSCDVNLERILFPEEIQVKYSMANISFNACAPTLLKKVLKRAQEIFEKNSDSFKSLPQNIIDAIVNSSMGDIRAAMHQFYMASLNGADLQIDVSIKEKQGLKRKRSEKKLTIKSMVKDETLGLFHGLGRVLNPKRCEYGSSWRINTDIQKLIDEFTVQPIKFSSFLSENYLKYFGDIVDISEASDILSLSNTLFLNWDNPELLNVALWVQVLGLMISNRHKESKWTQIKGPKKIEKICFNGAKEFIHPTDRYYYNLIKKTNTYHSFLKS